MRTLPDINVKWNWTPHAPNANTDAEVILAAATGIYNVVACVLYSYSATPTGGSITITDGTTTIVVAVLDAGPGKIELARPFVGINGAAVTTTLAAGGAGISGKINVQSA